MDIKKWFEDGTKMIIKELRWLKTPPLPYNIFTDDLIHRGADLLNNIIEHNITIEHYSEEINTLNEQLIDNFLISEKENGKFDNFEKSRQWLQEESMWATLYEISPFLEKIRKER